jgi:hypothetical protein
MGWWEILEGLIEVGVEERPLQASAYEPPITLDLRDEPCVRCGRPTRYATPGESGLPTCADCKAGLVRPRPRPRLCPADGTDLRPNQVSNVAIERCPTCSGVWLDGGELGLVTLAAVQAGKRDRGEAEELLATVLAGLPAKRPSGGAGE